MPSTINGIGTWYYGRRNLYTRQGTCESCGAYTALSSFDTTLFFVFVFIPLIPLARKRVLNECANCRRHRVAGLAEWEKQKVEEEIRVVAALREKPGDPDRAREALACVVGFQDDASFRNLVREFEGSYTPDAGLLAELGSAHAYFGHAQEAEQAFRDSLARRDDPDVRQMLALNLIRQGRPQEALPLLRPILDGAQADRIGHLALVVHGFQALGMHEEAIALLDECARVFPRETTDEEFVALRKASQKRLGTHKPVDSPLVHAPVMAAGESPLKSRFLRLIGPAVGLLVLAGYFTASWDQGRTRKVHVVNGLPKAYSVTVNGRGVMLPPMTHQTLEVEEGVLSVRVADSSLRIPDQTVTVETSFLLRPFLNRTFVINPDRVALVDRIQVEYAEVHPAGTAPTHELRVGSCAYEFSDIDFPFQTFPPAVKLSGSGARATRTSVQQVDLPDPSQALRFVHRQSGPAAAAAYLRTRLAAMPDDDVLLWTFVVQEGPEKALELLRPRLDDRPVLIDCHRTYQTLMERVHPEHDLEAEYRARLARDPKDAALTYLAGRALHDAAAAEAMYRRAVEGKAPCAHAYYALAYYRLSNGDFDAARDFAQKALALAPGRPVFLNAEKSALMGLGKFDDLLARNRVLQRTGELDADLIAEEIHLLLRSGQKEAAASAAKQACDRLLKAGGKEQHGIWADYFESVRLYSEGDVKGYAARIRSVPGPMTAFKAGLSAGRLDEASKIAGEMPPSEAVPHLLVHLAARQAGQAALSDAELKAGIRALQAGDYAQRLAGAALAGAEAPDVEAMLALPLQVAEKCVVLTVLGALYPADRDRYFELARKLNYDTGFPHHLLKEALKP